MTQNLKRDQLAPNKAENWRKNFHEEQKETFNLQVPTIILQKETYKTLIGENENRVRVYLGLEEKKEDGKYEMCAFAVSAFLLGSGDVYADYETPVFKLDKKNVDYSDSTDEVIKSIQLYRKWRAGEIDADVDGAAYRQYIYPNGYLLTKFELYELFNTQHHEEIQINFGISKSMNIMISEASSDTDGSSDSLEVYDDASLCPPFCDERSIYNS